MSLPSLEAATSSGFNLSGNEIGWATPVAVSRMTPAPVVPDRDRSWQCGSRARGSRRGDREDCVDDENVVHSQDSVGAKGLRCADVLRWQSRAACVSVRAVIRSRLAGLAAHVLRIPVGAHVEAKHALLAGAVAGGRAVGADVAGGIAHCIGPMLGEDSRRLRLLLQTGSAQESRCRCEDEEFRPNRVCGGHRVLWKVGNATCVEESPIRSLEVKRENDDKLAIGQQVSSRAPSGAPRRQVSVANGHLRAHRRDEDGVVRLEFRSRERGAGVDRRDVMPIRRPRRVRPTSASWSPRHGPMLTPGAATATARTPGCPQRPARR